MTDEDAKTKWCPFSRVSTNGVVVNRDNPNDGLMTTAEDACRCIASACMMWVSQTEYMNGRYRSTGRGDCGLKDARMINL